MHGRPVRHPRTVRHGRHFSQAGPGIGDGQNGPMLRVVPPPPHARHWVEAGVVVRLGATATLTRFPAMHHAMLTLRLLRAPGVGGPLGVLCPPVTFHTLCTAPTAHAHPGGITALGLLVRAPAAAALLGHAGGAAADLVLPWGLLAGDAEAARLEDEAQRATTEPACLQALLASFCRTMAALPHGGDPRPAQLCDAVGRLGAQAGPALGLGPRQLERLCHAMLGVSPKQYQRLVRFHGALSSALGAAPRAQADVALQAGYYDQSHLGRESRRLAGVALGALLPQAQQDSPWWPLATRRVIVQARATPALA
jgi:AraC-like DNA-binding protein